MDVKMGRFYYSWLHYLQISDSKASFVDLGVLTHTGQVLRQCLHIDKFNKYLLLFSLLFRIRLMIY